ncbi:MAG: hypothetical protein KIT00_05590 [Rhodospirillales bacterium]|nr:hypothetical protein [Rhodospirillales bacterium]
MNQYAQQTDPLTAVEENALALSQAAIRLDQARQNGKEPCALRCALDDNAELWIAIQTLVNRANGTLSPAVKSNLLKLGDFVVATTLRSNGHVAEQTLDTLININLQISEGLLEGQAR